MKNWLKKVLSWLIAIALLVSAGVLAFAEEPIDTGDAEEVVTNEETTESAPAQEPAEEATAPAAEEPSNTEEESSNEPEADPVPSYYNVDTPAAAEPAAESKKEEEIPSTNDPAAAEPSEEDTPVEETPDEAEDKVEVIFDEETGELIYTDDEGTYLDSDLTTFVEGDFGNSDQETVETMGLNMTDEIKFAEATWLALNDSQTGSVSEEEKAVYVIKWESNQAIVLGLEASSSELKVAINGTNIKFEETEGTEEQPGFTGTCKMNIVADSTYEIVLSSKNPVDYTLTVKEAFTIATEDNSENEETDTTVPAEVNHTEETVEDSTTDNHEETPAEEGNDNNDGETNTVEGTIVYEFPVIKGWITIDTEAFDIDDTITLKANADTELDDKVAWQTKVQNEEGEEAWENIGYGATLTVKLTKDNINSIFRFKMEGENTSDEFQLGKIVEETEEPEEATEGEEAEEEVTAEETEESEDDEEEASYIEMFPEISIDLKEDPITYRTEAYLTAVLDGITEDGIMIQWQISADREEWIDLEGETNSQLSITLSDDNRQYHWRVVVRIAENQEPLEST